MKGFVKELKPLQEGQLGHDIGYFKQGFYTQHTNAPQINLQDFQEVLLNAIGRHAAAIKTIKTAKKQRFVLAEIRSGHQVLRQADTAAAPVNNSAGSASASSH